MSTPIEPRLLLDVPAVTTAYPEDKAVTGDQAWLAWWSPKLSAGNAK